MRSKPLSALAALAVALLVSCTSTSAPATRAPIRDLHGVALGMSRDAVRAALADTATFAREERKRQEIWTLAGDPRFASLIIGYNEQWNVRFVTAVANENGPAVPYAEVLDVGGADHRSAGTSHTYTWTTGSPPYAVIAIGTPARVQYLSLKTLPVTKEEDD